MLRVRFRYLLILVLAELATILGCGETSLKTAGDGASPAKSRKSQQPAATASAQPTAQQDGGGTGIDPAGTPPPETTVLSGPPAERPARASEKTIPQSSVAATQTVYRPSDTRPVHDETRLAQLGIRVFESKRLKLYTDIDPQIARTLPAYVDAVYLAWEDYFGPLPPAREGTEFQMTGYLMADAELFRRTGLFPLDLPPFLNGRHRGAEFWMHDQEDDYYRRHLMIHEATHCFMTSIRDGRIAPWYLEGMAELFGTHATDAEGKPRFGVMPHNKEDFRGLGRITMVQIRCGEGAFMPLPEVIALDGNEFLQTEAYAWSWALCHFLNRHPRYRERFRELGGHLTPRAFRRGFFRAFRPDMAALKTEWCLFAHNLQDGYDVESTAIDFQPGEPFSAEQPSRKATIAANRGWQSGRVRVERGQTYRITARGRFTLADEPKPWVSEPQGVSIRYFQGRPLGMLLAVIRDETEQGLSTAGTGQESMLNVIPVGREREFMAEFTGTLYFRLNDSFSELRDNTGEVNVTVEGIQP